MQIRETLLSKSSAAEAAAAKRRPRRKPRAGARLKVEFVFDSPSKPQPKALSITKDVEVCGKHPLVNESLLVDSNGGLANVVLYVRNRNVEVHPDYAATANAKAVLGQSRLPLRAARAGDAHQPAVHHQELRRGGPQHQRRTQRERTVQRDHSRRQGSGRKARRRRTHAGHRHCNIHPWMKGYVVVLTHPYVAVSAKDGTFEIKNVPAGMPLEFQAWHEASTAGNGAVQTNRPDLKWANNGRFSVTLQPNEVMDLKEIKIPASALAAQ